MKAILLLLTAVVLIVATGCTDSNPSAIQPMKGEAPAKKKDSC